jgi:uncharacterized protein DUF4407
MSEINRTVQDQGSDGIDPTAGTVEVDIHTQSSHCEKATDARSEEKCFDLDKPKPPEWTAAKAGMLGRALMRTAGIDLSLAETMPTDEQQQIKRVGLALIFGVTFQAICFSTALIVGYGLQWWTAPVTFVLCGIMWAYDTKFVASDWAAQGAAYCRLHRLITDTPWSERWVRPAATAIRWIMSLFIALTLAVFVLLQLFAPDIESYWRGIHRTQNAPLAAEATRRYEALIDDLLQRTRRYDEKLDQLTRERARVLEQAAPVSSLEAQISDLLAHIKDLEAAKAAAETRAAAQAESARAELRGIRVKPDNTGIAGKGAFYEFHNDMMEQENSIIRERTNEIAAANFEIAELRAQRASTLQAAENDTHEELRGLDGNIEQTSQVRAGLGADRKQLEDSRETWIEDHMRGMSDYVPMPTGILAKLTGLWIVIAGNSLIASLVFSVKVVVMLLESAGPVAKVFFTKSGIYQMTVALRLHDATEAEVDRRSKWRHWRELQRNRSHEAISSINDARRRQETRDRAIEAVDKIVRKFSWLQ